MKNKVKHPKIRGEERQKELEKNKTTEEILETEVTSEEKKDLIKKLRDPNLLLIIKIELDKDHIGDDKPKLFLFCDCLSSQLKPEYRFSTALTGDTAEGKTNLKDTVFRHLPEEWFIDLTRVTGASLEDDIHHVNLIYFGEEGPNKNIMEQVKQLVEDGMDVLKKDSREDFKESRREKQPRKVGIYSTTGSQDDKELSSRYCVSSVHGNENKYKRVNRNTLDVASDINKEIEKNRRKKEPTWIEKCLRLLEPFDIITIPYAPLFEVESRKGRSQRDLKRFLNLIRVLAWLHQFDRVSYTYQGLRILVVSPEDCYNAMEIGDEIFSQTISNLEPRLQEVIDCYKKLREHQTKIIEIEDDQDLEWVDRSLIQKELGIDSVDSIKKRIKKLSDLNIFTYEYNKAKNRCYVAFKKFDNNTSPTILPTKNLLITYEAKPLYDIIKANYLLILKNQLVGPWQVKFKEKKNNTNLLLLRNEVPTNLAEKTLFNDLKQQFLTKNQKISRSNKQVNIVSDKIGFNDKIKELREYCKKLELENTSNTYDNLCYNFDKSFIERCKQDNLLISHPKMGYVWRD